MKKRKIALILAILIAAEAAGYKTGSEAATRQQEKEADRQQSEVVTLQIYNEELKTWDTYQ